MFDEQERHLIKRLDVLINELAEVHSQQSVTELIATENAWKTVLDLWIQLQDQDIKSYLIYLSFYQAVTESVTELITQETQRQFERIVNND